MFSEKYHFGKDKARNIFLSLILHLSSVGKEGGSFWFSETS